MLQAEPLLMDLLVKNVSSDNPLSENELFVLKDFRSRLANNDEWKKCLQLARDERARRRAMINDEEENLVQESQVHNEVISSDSEDSKLELNAAHFTTRSAANENSRFAQTAILSISQNSREISQNDGKIFQEHKESVSQNFNGNQEIVTDLRAAQDLAHSNLLRMESALAAARFFLLSVEEDHSSVQLSKDKSLCNWISAMKLVTNSLDKSQQSIVQLEQQLGNVISHVSKKNIHGPVVSSSEKLNSGKYCYQFTENAKHNKKFNHSADGCYDDRGREQRYPLRSSSPPMRKSRSPSFGRSSSPAVVPNSVIIDGHRYQLQSLIEPSRASVPKHSVEEPLALISSPNPLRSRVCVQLYNPGGGRHASGSKNGGPKADVPQKSRHDLPLVVNPELGTVEVIWRQHKSVSINEDANGGLYSDGHTLADGISRHDRALKSQPEDRRALRREKFEFDAFFDKVSSSAILDVEIDESPAVSSLPPSNTLETYACELTRRALYKGSDLVHVALVCGDQRDYSRSLEPPLALFLGEAGGCGVVYNTIAEALTFYDTDSVAREPPADLGSVRVPRRPEHQPKPKFKSVMHSGAKHLSSAMVVAASSFIPDITVSAVLVCNGMLSDLLSTAPVDLMAEKSVSNQSACYIDNHSDGTAFIANAAHVRVRSLADYERLVGILLGRKAATRDVLPVIMKELRGKKEKEEDDFRKSFLSGNQTPLQQQPFEDGSPRSSGEPTSPGKLEVEGASSALAASLIGGLPATLLLTVTVRHCGGESNKTCLNTDGYTTTPGARGSLYASPHENRASSRTVNCSRFFFACPYGDSWTTPGPDLQSLVEALAYSPHLERPMSTFVNNPMTALVLNMNVQHLRAAGQGSGNASARSTSNRVKRDKESVRNMPEFASAHKSRIETPASKFQVKHDKLDVNIILGVSDFRSRKAEIHNSIQSANEREALMNAITRRSLQVLRLATLLESNANL